MLWKIKSVIGLKIKDYILSFLSASLLILSFPTFNLWLLAWVALVPLFFALQNSSLFKAFFISYLTGLLFFAGTLYWLIHVSLPGLIILVLYLALYFGLFGLLISKTYQPINLSTYQLIFIPSFWVALEYLRSRLFTGFGWATLGYSQYLNLALIQIADITGVYGVSFLVVMVNVGIYSLLHATRYTLHATGYRLQDKKNSIHHLAFCITTVVIVLIYGFFRLNQNVESESLRVCVIQGNIPQSLKWHKEAKSFIYERYFALTRLAIKDKSHLIIWPESAVPDYLKIRMNTDKRIGLTQIKELVEEFRVPLLTGVVIEDEDNFYNSAVLLSKGNERMQRYDKLHLVPFGEYIPLRGIFSFLEDIYPIGDFKAGKNYTIFQHPAKFGVLICFEDVFPYLSRGFVKKGAEFLINITNDAWFKQTSSSYQHLIASIFRAVENRRSLIRAANTGISGFISPQGKAISLVSNRDGKEIFVSGYKTEKIELRKDITFYTRFGDVFAWMCVVIAIFGLWSKMGYTHEKPEQK